MPGEPGESESARFPTPRVSRVYVFSTRRVATSRSQSRVRTFYWFKRGPELCRYEAREVSPTHYELAIIGPVGVERVERFATAEALHQRRSRWRGNWLPKAGSVPTAGTSNAAVPLR
jgi:hypothetical protein